MLFQIKITTLMVLALAFAVPSSWAQTVYEDQTVGHTSPIPDSETAITYGREYDGLKPGQGREEVYFAFSPCLKTGWIKRQNLTSDQWLIEVQKMAEQCGIAPLGADETSVIIGYLTTYYGPQQ